MILLLPFAAVGHDDGGVLLADLFHDLGPQLAARVLVATSLKTMTRFGQSKRELAIQAEGWRQTF